MYILKRKKGLFFIFLYYYYLFGYSPVADFVAFSEVDSAVAAHSVRVRLGIGPG